VGRFEAAHDGTIFLDEIGEISPALQVKLLHVLQDHEFQRVGSSRTMKANVRVIAATNRDLKAAMREGRFREDLFYRLHVIPITIPPLRERKEDIPMLVEHVIKSLRKRGLDRVRNVSPEAMRCLMDYRWPGNVRELENVLERGVVCARGPVLSCDALAEEVRELCRGPHRVGAPPPPAVVPSAEETVPPSGPDDEEKQQLVRVLESHRWNRGEAAAALGVDRTTLWRRMKRHGLA
jgi:transcriptional regulator with GAF, ATPase, and Fis domain